MKKTKKIVAALLSLMMVATMAFASFPVIAETTAPFTVGTETFDSLAAAIDGVKASEAEDKTIYMNSDYTTGTADKEKLVLDGVEIVIDGKNKAHSLTLGDNWDYAALLEANASLTIQNVNVLATKSQGFWFRNSGSEVIVNNVNEIQCAKRLFVFDRQLAGPDLADTNPETNACTAIASDVGKITFSGDKDRYLVETIDSDKIYTINVELKNIPEISGNGILLNLNGTKHNVKVENVTATTNTGFIKLGGGRTATVDVVNTDYTMTGNGTVLQAVGESELTLNLDAQTKFTIDTATVTDGKFGTGTLKITDGGASYCVTAAVADATIALPTGGGIYVEQLAEDATGTAHSVASGAAFTHTAGSAAITFKLGEAIAADAFANVTGAAIRTEEPYGLRFFAKIDKTLYNYLTANGETCEFGIIIAPYSYVNTTKTPTSENFKNLKDTQYVKIAVDSEDFVDAGDYYLLSASIYVASNEALTETYKAQLTTRFSACAYYKVGDIIAYADYNKDNNSRSIYDVAVNYCEAEHAGVTSACPEFVQNVLNKCGYVSK